LPWVFDEAQKRVADQVRSRTAAGHQEQGGKPQDFLLRQLLAVHLGLDEPGQRVVFRHCSPLVELRAGAGGSLVIADADRRLTVAYVMNKMVPCQVVTPITAALVERVYDIVRR
jgi:hypothetical protein